MSAALLFPMMRAVEDLSAEALPSMHRLVLFALADFADDEGLAWPSTARIAKRTGQAARTVEVCIAELRAAGWLELERQGGGSASNRYRVRTKGGAIERDRQGRHAKAETPAPRSSPAPGATVDPRAPCVAPPRPAADTPAPPADDPIRDPIKDPTSGRAHTPAPRSGVQAKQEPLRLEPSGAKAETALEVFWRVFRELWRAKYGRKFISTGQDDAAVKVLAKRAAEWCSAEGKTGPGDIERLVRWWVSKFLEDRGRISRPGEQGYLETTYHRPKDLEAGLAAYGTPWDRAERREQPPPPVDEQPIGPRQVVRRPPAAIDPAAIFGRSS